MPDEKPSEERLEELEDHIQEARAHAREIIDEPNPEEPAFYESGEVGKELDDQEIAPPG